MNLKLIHYNLKKKKKKGNPIFKKEKEFVSTLFNFIKKI